MYMQVPGKDSFFLVVYRLTMLFLEARQLWLRAFLEFAVMNQNPHREEAD